MDGKPNHILAKSGILASFSISKKVTEQEIDSMLQSAKNKGKNEAEVAEIVKAKIMKEIIDATQKGTLPGIIIENFKNPVIPIQSIESLNRMVMVVSQKMKDKKFDKMSLCYFVNYLVGSLGLTEEDFEEFHRRIKESQDENEDDD